MKSLPLAVAVLLLPLVACDGSGPGQCVPGESIACACPDGSDGSQVCAGDGLSFAECLCEPAEGTTGDVDESASANSGDDTEIPDHDHEPSGWMLRDADGEIVDAVVEPACAFGKNCTGNGTPLECVTVFYYEDEFRNFTYGLADGTWTACAKPVEPYWYADAECSEPMVRDADESTERGAVLGSIVNIGGEPYRVGDGYVERGHCVVVDGECSCGDGQSFATLTHVDIVNLGDAPYSVSP